MPGVGRVGTADTAGDRNFADLGTVPLDRTVEHLPADPTPPAS